MLWMYLALIAMLWGVGNVLVKRGLTHLTAWQTYALDADSIVGIILLNFGNIAYYIALQMGFASLVVPLSSTYVLLMVLLSMIWLKEKVYDHQLVGIGLSVVGIILAGFFSGGSG